MVPDPSSGEAKAKKPISDTTHLRDIAVGFWEAPEWIANQMGHTTTTMLFRVYSRYVPNLTRRDGSAFTNFLLNGGEL